MHEKKFKFGKRKLRDLLADEAVSLSGVLHDECLPVSPVLDFNGIVPIDTEPVLLVSPTSSNIVTEAFLLFMNGVTGGCTDSTWFDAITSVLIVSKDITMKIA